MLPERRGGLPPDDFIAGEILVGDGLPGQGRVVLDRPDLDRRLLRGWGSEGEGRHRRRVHAGHVGDIGEIDLLGHVPIRHAVLDADVLVLAIEVLGRLGEADGRDIPREERHVVAASQVAIGPEDRPGPEPGDVERGRLVDEPRQLPRRAVILAADGSKAGRQRRCPGVGQPFGEDAEGPIVAPASAALGVADDVVGDHRLDLAPRSSRLFGVMGRAEEALFLPREGDEHDRGVEFVRAHRLGQLHHDGRAAGVVIGSRGRRRSESPLVEQDRGHSGLRRRSRDRATACPAGSRPRSRPRSRP